MINEQELSDKLFAVEDGEQDALVVYAEIKKAIKLLTEAEAQIKDAALEESEQYESHFEFKGHTFERRNGGRTYDYKNDGVWCDLNAKRKQREELMKQALNGTEIYGEDGVQVPSPTVKFRSDSLIIK